MNGKAAIITGGALGIGEAVGRLFARSGCKVALLDVGEERLLRVTKEISGAGGECVSFVTDVANEAQAIGTFADVNKKWGSIDLLVNSDGRDSLSPQVSQVTREEWR